MDIELHVIARLVVAAGLGALIGLEREASDQPAGLRTHLTVALGAALFGVISTVGFEEFRDTQRAVNIQFDVTRVASTVVTGIGFLGAGMIFRRGSVVHNLTTAASLWVVAAVGLACGVGDLGPATVTALILVLALAVLRLPRALVRRHVTREKDAVRIVLQPDRPEAPVVAALQAISGVEVERLGIEKEDGSMVVVANLRARGGVDPRPGLNEVARRPDVRTMSVGGPPEA